ncbi:hypothetical protein BRADI_3g32876v3 [Brachypodium distachyon]|uniref:Uncharacterized protein n=1 Tax=Brachypodium distachyon TaxID=15368 RepID=A0A2K2D0P5_BRADI|nr:hypothetical protein BRADI_3g32876v3 [Brachypodium distachyon]
MGGGIGTSANLINPDKESICSKMFFFLREMQDVLFFFLRGCKMLGSRGLVPLQESGQREYLYVVITDCLNARCSLFF